MIFQIFSLLLAVDNNLHSPRNHRIRLSLILTLLSPAIASPLHTKSAKITNQKRTQCQPEIYSKSTKSGSKTYLVGGMHPEVSKIPQRLFRRGSLFFPNVQIPLKNLVLRRPYLLILAMKEHLVVRWGHERRLSWKLDSNIALELNSMLYSPFWEFVARCSVSVALGGLIRVLDLLCLTCCCGCKAVWRSLLCWPDFFLFVMKFVIKAIFD